MLPIVLTLFGIFTFSSDKQIENADFPISVTQFFIITSVILRQSRNAWLPIVSTSLGIVNVPLRFSQNANAKSPISVRLSRRFTLERELQYSNAEFPMIFTLLDIVTPVTSSFFATARSL